MPPQLSAAWFGALPYESALALQLDWVERRCRDDVGDTILFGEHPPVITLGRGTHPENLLATGDIPIIQTTRGGDVTYHGPGQLIAYPILKLDAHERDLHQLLRHLEDALIRGLATYGITAGRNPGWTGVWVGTQKVASIGVAIRRWVTYHGIALNVTTPATDFARIRPCGLDDAIMAPLADFAPPGTFKDLQTVAQQLLPAFATALGRQLADPAWVASSAQM